MSSNDSTETVATFTHDGAAYEIDHLGICAPSQEGTYVIYRDGTQVAEFEPENAPEDITNEQLIEHAIAALQVEDGQR